MKSTTRSALLAVLLSVLLSAAALVLPSSAQARDHAWSSWTHRSYQVKARYDMYFTPGTKSVWQFQRAHGHPGKRQVRVNVADWNVQTGALTNWRASAWKGIKPGARVTITGPLVFGCYYRDGHGYEMVGEVRAKVHGVWSAPRELTSSMASGSLGC
jgi:hypothetical protein